MALVDMKSDLSKNAGKPLGKQSGRHGGPSHQSEHSTKDFDSPILTNPGGRLEGLAKDVANLSQIGDRHESSHQSEHSTKDFDSPTLTTPGGRLEGLAKDVANLSQIGDRHDISHQSEHSIKDLDSPILGNPGGRHYTAVESDPPPSIAPNPEKSKSDILLAQAKTKAMDFIVQKVKNIPNPASKYFTTSQWGGFIEKLLPGTPEISEPTFGVIGMLTGDVPHTHIENYSHLSQGQIKAPNSYMENFFKYISPKFEIWPRSAANIGGKLLPVAVLSAVATETNLFLTDYFDNTHAFGFTKNMHETRFKGAGAEYDPQNERNKILSKVAATTAFVSNVLNVGGFIKNFLGKMKNSPSTSNYKGVDDGAGTYTPVKDTGYLHPTPGYLNPTSGFDKNFSTTNQSMDKAAPTLYIENVKSIPDGNKSNYFGGKKYSQAPPPGQGGLDLTENNKYKSWEGFKTRLNVGDVTSQLEAMWSGTSLYQASVKRQDNENIRDFKRRERRVRNAERTQLLREAAGLGPDDPGVVTGHIIHGHDGKGPFIELVPGSLRINQPIDKTDHTSGGDPQVTRVATTPGIVKTEDAIAPIGTIKSDGKPAGEGRLQKLWDDTEKLVGVGTPAAGAGLTFLAGGTSVLYSKIKTYQQQSGQINVPGPVELANVDISLTGDDTQERWDPIGERFLSGPMATTRNATRFLRFSKTPQFVIFEAKQFALQGLNAAAEARIYNPLSIASSLSNLVHAQRHIAAKDTYGKVMGGETDAALIYIGSRVEHQSPFTKGTSFQTIDPKKVDPNRHTGAFAGLNKLALGGIKAGTMSTQAGEGFKYTQAEKITKGTHTYTNILSPEHPYLQSHAVQDKMSEETLAKGKGQGFPRRLIVPLNRTVTFSKDGKQEVKQKKSAVEKTYEKFQSSPSEISKGHSGFDGDNFAKGDVGVGSNMKYSTLNVLAKGFKPTNVGATSAPEGGYEKTGLVAKDVNLEPNAPGAHLESDKLGFAKAAKFGTNRADPYKSGQNGTEDKVNASKYGTDIDKDLVPFKFKDVYNDKVIVFRAIFASITDTLAPDWSKVEYVGRPDAVHVYKGVTRSINIGFTIYPYTYKEFKILWAKFNYFMGLVYPNYEDLNFGGQRMVAPIIELTIGNLYKDVPGFLDTMTVTYDTTKTWEIKKKEKLPHKIDVVTDFKYIGKEQFSMTGKNNFDFDAGTWNA